MRRAEKEGTKRERDCRDEVFPSAPTMKTLAFTHLLTPHVSRCAVARFPNMRQPHIHISILRRVVRVAYVISVA